MEVLFGHQIRPPRGHATCAVVELTDNGHALGVRIGLHARVARGGTVYGHRSVQWRDAGVGAVHTPRACCFLFDLDHSAAMGCHLDVYQLWGHASKIRTVLTAQGGEHDFLVGVFMVHAKHPARACGVERGEANVVVVIAELLELCGSGLVHHIKLGRVQCDRIAPPQQDIGVIAFGDMVRGVIAPLKLGEVIARCGASGCLFRGHEGRGAKERSRRCHRQSPAKQITVGVARSNHFANCAGEIRVCGDVVKRLIGFGFVADGGIV